VDAEAKQIAFGGGEEPSRYRADNDQWQTRTDAENRHHQRHLGEILALARKRRGRAECRSDARRPHQPQQQSDDQLPAQAFDANPAQPSVTEGTKRRRRA